MPKTTGYQHKKQTLLTLREQERLAKKERDALEIADIQLAEKTAEEIEEKKATLEEMRAEIRTQALIYRLAQIQRAVNEGGILASRAIELKENKIYMPRVLQEIKRQKDAEKKARDNLLKANYAWPKISSSPSASSTATGQEVPPPTQPGGSRRKRRQNLTRRRRHRRR